MNRIHDVPAANPNLRDDLIDGESSLHFVLDSGAADLNAVIPRVILPPVYLDVPDVRRSHSDGRDARSARADLSADALPRTPAEVSSSPPSDTAYIVALTRDSLGGVHRRYPVGHRRNAVSRRLPEEGSALKARSRAGLPTVRDVNDDALAGLRSIEAEYSHR